MMRSYEDVLEFVEEENVKFIRLSFTDVRGVMKNMAIMPERLAKAFRTGVAFDASAISGFGTAARSDLILFPDAATLALVPWRPVDGRVARMFCDVKYPDGRIFEKDTRYILKTAQEKAAAQGFDFLAGTDYEFYLFKLDENGEPTKIPQDTAGYLDIAPEDKGENIRRDICFNLVEMGILPRASHHEAGPGQNEVDFEFRDPLTAADNAMVFKWMVRSVSASNGLWADFSPKPFDDREGNGLHLNLVLKREDGRDLADAFAAGILDHVREMTLFLNPEDASYSRLGSAKAPKFVSWSSQNRSQLLRIRKEADGVHLCLRSPDPAANPYLAYALLIEAGLDGVRRGLTLEAPCDRDLYSADPAVTQAYPSLPKDRAEAVAIARASAFIRSVVPDAVIEAFCE